MSCPSSSHYLVLADMGWHHSQPKEKEPEEGVPHVPPQHSDSWLSHSTSLGRSTPSTNSRSGWSYSTNRTHQQIQGQVGRIAPTEPIEATEDGIALNYCLLPSNLLKEKIKHQPVPQQNLRISTSCLSGLVGN